MTAAKILIVEDDPVLATVLSQHLGRIGYETQIESGGAGTSDRLRDGSFDAVVLDGNLPDVDGFEICRRIRPWYRGAILMLTSRDDDLDRIMGLELGADDYLVKPVRPQVVMAHLKACLRRTADAAAPSSEEEIAYGRFRINRAARTVVLGDADVNLTTAEFDLLWLLAEKAGSVLSRDDIMGGMRGIDHDGLDRSIDMRVSRLRRRLGDDPDRPVLIKTVRGKGYLFSKTGW